MFFQKGFLSFKPVTVINNGVQAPAALKVNVSFTRITFIVSLSLIIYFDWLTHDFKDLLLTKPYLGWVIELPSSEQHYESR